MSNKVREWLKRLGLFEKTTHEDREKIDEEIERRKDTNCDRAIEEGLVREQEFREIVALILGRKKKKKEVVPMVI